MMGDKFAGYDTEMEDGLMMMIMMQVRMSTKTKVGETEMECGSGVDVCMHADGEFRCIKWLVVGCQSRAIFGSADGMKKV